MSGLPAQGDRPDRPLDDVRIQLEPAVVEEQRQPLPVAQGVADRFGERGFARHAVELGGEPAVQGVHDRLAPLLPDRTPLLGGAATDLGLDPVELPDSA